GPPCTPLNCQHWIICSNPCALPGCMKHCVRHCPGKIPELFRKYKNRAESPSNKVPSRFWCRLLLFGEHKPKATTLGSTWTTNRICYAFHWPVLKRNGQPMILCESIAHTL